MSDRIAWRAALCLVTTIAVVTAHELLHIAVGHWVGIGGHFTSLTSADADPARLLTASASARASMAGVGPLFTGAIGIGALFAAPWARRRRLYRLAAVLGWIAIFGVPYIGIQLMTLGGPAGGVDTAAVLVGYFGIAGLTRAVLAVAGVGFTIGAGFVLGNALGEQQAVSSTTGVSPTRRVVGTAFVGLSIVLIGTGAALLARGRGNPMGPFLLADVLWAVGMVIKTPWRQPGSRFVRDVWLVPGIMAMSVLTIVGLLLPSDYAAAALFFLPQLATAAYAARGQEFREASYATDGHSLGIAARVVC